MKSQRGFLLMEALILVLILSLTFVSFLGVIAQALKISARDQEMMQGLRRYEDLLFEVESGLRPDLARFGGHGDLGGGYGYEVHNEEERDSYSLLKSRLTWKQGKEFLDFDFFVSQGVLE